jgi:hypothetical protein
LSLFTPELTEDLYTDDEDTTYQSLYSDLNFHFSQENMVANSSHILGRAHTFSSLIDGEGSENEAVESDKRGNDKERINMYHHHQQFFISRNDIPLFN